MGAWSRVEERRMEKGEIIIRARNPIMEYRKELGKKELDMIDKNMAGKLRSGNI